MTETNYNDIQATNVAKPQEATPNDGKVDVAQRQPKKALVSSSTEPLKPSLMTRLVKGLIGPNGVRAIFGYLGREVIVPAIKDTVVNSITTGVNMAAYGEDRGRYNNSPGWNNPMRSSGVQGSRTYTNYSSAYHPTSVIEPQPVNNPGRVKEIYLFTHNDAKVVLDSLNSDIMPVLLTTMIMQVSLAQTIRTTHMVGETSIVSVSFLSAVNTHLLCRL